MARASVQAPWARPRREVAPRVHVSFWCSNGHETRPSFSEEPGLTIPEQWDCPRCGFPAGRDEDNPPAPPKVEPYKTHLAYVKERRDEDGEAILDEACDASGTAASSSRSGWSRRLSCGRCARGVRSREASPAPGPSSALRRACA